IAPRLLPVERTALEEDVGGLRERRRLRQHLAEEEVDVCVRTGVRELGRYRMRTEPGRDAARVADGPELGELRVPVEAVPGLRLERRRPSLEHPVPVTRGRS